MAPTIDDALRKLAPLRPQEVRRWKRQLPYLEERTRRLVELKILRTAQELLGDYDSRLLLSCPTRELCKGDIEIGRVVYERELWPFALKEGELLQHTGIFGRSGSGKTNLVFHILKQLVERRVPFLFFDWKRTARHLLPALGRKVELYTPGRSLLPFAFNPFLCPPGIDRHVHITQVVDLLGRAFTLGDGAKSILHKAMSESSESCTVAELLSKVEGMDSKGRQGGWKVSAVRCLQTMLFTDVVHQGPGRQGTQQSTVEQFFDRSTVLELNGLNENAKRFLIPAILSWVYQVRLGSRDRERLRLVVVLEESHHVLGDRQSEHFFGRFLRQCRELGIAVVLVDQAPSLMSSVALGNCFATAILNLKDPDDIRVAAGLLQLSEKERAQVSQLPVGRAIVKLQDRWRSSFVIQVPHVALRKGSMTDDGLRLFLADLTARSTESATVGAEEEDIRQVRLADEVLNPEAFKFLLDVLEHRDSGVKERYRRLGWSVDRGNRIKQQLLRIGLLDGMLIGLGTTRKLVLRPTKEGRRLLGIETGSTVESLAHEFWKRRLAHEYAACGWRVEVEGLRDPKRPELGRADLVLIRGGEQCGVEVETGKSDFVQNLRLSLQAGLPRVIIAATEEKARMQVESVIASAGLLVAGRVSVELASRVPMATR